MTGKTYLYVMEKEKLKELFEENDAKQADFIAWADSNGVQIRSSDVSRHVTKGGISRWAKLAYLAFFREFTPRGYIVPDQLFNDSTMKILKESFKDFTIADMNARLKELEEKLQ